MSDQKKENQELLENLRDDLIASQKGMDAKLNSNQSQAGVIAMIQKDVTTLKENLLKSQTSVDDIKDEQTEMFQNILRELA